MPSFSVHFDPIFSLPSGTSSSTNTEEIPITAEISTEYIYTYPLGLTTITTTLTTIYTDSPTSPSITPSIEMTTMIVECPVCEEMTVTLTVPVNIAASIPPQPTSPVVTNYGPTPTPIPTSCEEDEEPTTTKTMTISSIITATTTDIVVVVVTSNVLVIPVKEVLTSLNAPTVTCDTSTISSMTSSMGYANGSSVVGGGNLTMGTAIGMGKMAVQTGEAGMVASGRGSGLWVVWIVSGILGMRLFDWVVR